VFTRKQGAKLAAFSAAAMLVLAACGGDDDGDGDADVEALPGLDACADQPNDCNAGERGEGGEVTFLVNQGHDGVYNHLRPEGGSVYLIQMMAGLGIDDNNPGYFTPDGEWTWDMDLLAAEPELVSEDPLTVTYQIREEAVWSDGEPIDYDDVLWNWYARSGSPDHCDGCEPRATSFYDEMASIEASEDGKTITVTYNDGFAHPEWYAVTLFSYPAHIAEAEVGDWQNDPAAMGESSLYFLNNAPPVSAGPYVVESWTADETQVLVPNENWFGATQPTLETIVKQIISDQPSWVPAMANGEINGGAPASFTADLAQQIAEIPGVYTGLGSAGAVWEHVDVNMDSLDDVALRKAIFTTLDTEDALSRIFGDLEELPPLRTNFMFSETSQFHEDLMTEGYGSGDVEAARAILEEAGYTGAESGGTLTDPDGEAVKDIRFAFLAGNENRNTYTQLAQSYLAEIGITVTPEAIPGDRLGTVLGEQDFDLVIFGWSGSPLFVNSSHQFYHSESGSNFGKLSNAELDQLVTDLRNQLELEDSATMANDAGRIVMDEAYSLPLWDTLNFTFVSDQYVNIRDNHNSSLRSFYNTQEWGTVATVE
jgi:peptide/nickel transport system substrate-binding protein